MARLVLAGVEKVYKVAARVGCNHATSHLLTAGAALRA